MAEIKTPPDRRSNRMILVGVIAVLILAAGTYLYAGWTGYQEAPKRIEVPDPEPPGDDPYTLSPDQVNSRGAYGDPEAFTILFYEEETPDQGIQTVRLETWDYYTLELGLTFINGELVAEDPLEVGELGALSRLPYQPQQFSAFMSLDDLISSAGIETYLEIPLTRESMEKGNLYYADSLSFGLQGDQLIYVEALALIEN